MNDEERERAERIAEVKRDLAQSFELSVSGEADYSQMENDVWVEGPLSEIFEWAQDWRSEIEELGE